MVLRIWSCKQSCEIKESSGNVIEWSIKCKSISSFCEERLEKKLTAAPEKKNN